MYRVGLVNKVPVGRALLFCQGHSTLALDEYRVRRGPSISSGRLFLAHKGRVETTNGMSASTEGNVLLAKEFYFHVVWNSPGGVTSAESGRR